MKRTSSESSLLVNETLLGGASMHISDLARFESQEIKWVIKTKDKRDLEITPIMT